MLFKKISFKSHCFVLSLFFVAVLLFCCTVYVSAKPRYERNAMIGELVATFLQMNHYRDIANADPEMSGKAFDLLLNSIDPNRMFFTAADLRQFAGDRETMMIDVASGDVSLGRKLYTVYRERFRQYHAFALAMLQQEIDFTVEEYIEVDRSEAEPFATETEMLDYWRRKIKNDLLYYRLLERSLQLESNSVSEGEDAEKAAIKALWEISSPEEKLKRRLQDIANVVEQTTEDEILELQLTALAQVYGPHSAYYSPAHAEDFDIDMSLSLTGIGATLSSADGFTRVVNLVPGGPADKDGTLQPEDRIIAVAQEGEQPVDVIDMALDKVVDLIRGEPGTRVTLTFLPGNKGRNAVPQSVTITRAVVELKDSEVTGTVKTVPDPADPSRQMKIGVIEFSKFYVDFEAMARMDPGFKSCSKDMRRELEKLKQENVEAVIIDLRSNTGGGLNEALIISGFFIKDGPLLQIRGADGTVALERDMDKGIVYDGPLVMLTSSITASAAEILTGTVKDYRRGIVVGDTNTYGKGTILNVIELDELFRNINIRLNAGTLQYENAIFFGVSGASNQQIGIRSDIVLPSLSDEMPIGESLTPNHLPWECIAPVKYSVWDKDLDSRISLLESRSVERRETNADFQQLMHEIETYRIYQQKERISLCEEERWAEYMEERIASEKQEELMLGDGNGTDGKGKDPLLAETLLIAADYAALLRDGQL